MYRLVSLLIVTASFVLVPFFSYAQASGWRNIGFRYLGEGQPEKAIPFFRLAVSADGSQGAYREELAYALQQNKQYDEALTEYTAALGLLGASVKNIKYNMALIYAAQHNYAQARQYISDVLQIDSEVSTAYLNRANFNVHLQNYEGAKSDYSKYLELEPDDAQAQDITRMIEILTQLPASTPNKEDQEKQRRQLQKELIRQRTKLNEALGIRGINTP